MGTPEIKKVHEDERGIIYTFFIDGKEELLTFTKQDYMRGGHSHRDAQHTMVLSGSIEWREWKNDHEEVFILNEGDKHVAPSFVPHLMTAICDCWILETKVDNDNDFAKISAKNYRKQVEKGIK